MCTCSSSCSLFLDWELWGRDCLCFLVLASHWGDGWMNSIDHGGVASSLLTWSMDFATKCYHRTKEATILQATFIVCHTHTSKTLCDTVTGGWSLWSDYYFFHQYLSTCFFLNCFLMSPTITYYQWIYSSLKTYSLFWCTFLNAVCGCGCVYTSQHVCGAKFWF